MNVSATIHCCHGTTTAAAQKLHFAASVFRVMTYRITIKKQLITYICELMRETN